MAKLKVAVDVPITPEKAWEHASDLAELGSWLTMHEGWRGEVPAELTPGATLVGVATVKGLRNRVSWTVETARPPRELVLRGAGKGGTRFGLGMTVAAADGGSRVTVDIELGGAPLFGPIGAGVAKAIRGDIERSLDNFVARYGSA
ncbi:MAG TPA: SRPBCC family protein [Nocardia sp.]|uniref:type II toxin-antitoxin system Rv0910 family toxin n=1 Tax=Nocardia TaxID=1817 RepID=UPI0024588902|nr:MULTISPECIES: SRPBCC family protein [Nocardia]HLS75567.1 SRPBCC family protein [Nocardia sp.]